MTHLLLQGDARHIPLADESVNCVVTSPPYWKLRDYGVVGQLGLEPTPDAYVASLLAVFREVWRVLRKDGVVFLNLGDSYVGSGKGPTGHNGIGNQSRRQGFDSPKVVIPPGLKPKDLVGIPWRVALALQQPYHTGPIKRLEDRMWLAGLTDGEGCLTILETNSPHGSGKSYPPIYQIRMCDLGPIEHCAAITGYGNASPKQEPPSQPGQRGAYQWRLNGRKAADVAAEVYPYLYVKRKQAVVVWNHQAVRDSYETKRGQHIPVAAVEKQQFCRSLIQRLNASEAVDLPSWMVEPPMLQEPGFYLRSDVIWHKPNPMPESVTDRPTRSHEYVFMLTKSARYWYDAEAVKEPAETGKWPGIGPQHATERDRNEKYEPMDAHPTRNCRSVWSIATSPYKGAHYATFPPKLAERCILAGCPAKVCAKCGKPWERVVERENTTRTFPDNGKGVDERKADGTNLRAGEVHTVTLGFRPTCDCNAETVPGIVFDPFAGSGTTVAVAVKLGRRGIGLDLNPKYLAENAEPRVAATAPMLIPA